MRQSSTARSTAAESAASSSGPLSRGTTATIPASAIVATWTTVWSDARSGIPRASYGPQPQIENGDGRSIWKPTVRSQNVSIASRSEGSRRRIEKAASVASAKPSVKRPILAGLPAERYVSQSGASASAANFVQPASAVATPRAVGEEASQNPHTRSAGMIASFVFDISAYAVNG